jgi:hypothetical protein
VVLTGVLTVLIERRGEDEEQGEGIGRETGDQKRTEEK